MPVTVSRFSWKSNDVVLIHLVVFMMFGSCLVLFFICVCVCVCVCVLLH